MLRNRSIPHHHKVTAVELFFDLVFIFAITQLSHYLIEHFTFVGGVQTLLLLVAVWWVWISTTWVTNWLDPDKLPVRVLLLALILPGLVGASAIPGAFDGRGLAVALAYLSIQVGRTLFFLWAAKEHVKAGAQLSTRSSLAFGRRRVLDSRRRGRPICADVVVGDSPCRRVPFSVARILGAWTRTVVDDRLGDRGGLYGGTVRTLHHHRAWRVDPRDRIHVQRTGVEPWEYSDARRVIGGKRRDVVAVLRYHCGDWATGDVEVGRSR